MTLPSMMSERRVWSSLRFRFSEAFTGRLVCRDMMIPFLECFYEAISTKIRSYFLHVIIQSIATWCLSSSFVAHMPF